MLSGEIAQNFCCVCVCDHSVLFTLVVNRFLSSNIII